jgi:hypothetical protein
VRLHRRDTAGGGIAAGMNMTPSAGTYVLFSAPAAGAASARAPMGGLPARWVRWPAAADRHGEPEAGGVAITAGTPSPRTAPAIPYTAPTL